jgi:H+/Cl- antiporter ClcA
MANPSTPEAAALRKATARRARTEDAWRTAILAASAAGMSERAIAPLAGVSHQRVHQILSTVTRPAS